MRPNLSSRKATPRSIPRPGVRTYRGFRGWSGWREVVLALSARLAQAAVKSSGFKKYRVCSTSSDYSTILARPNSDACTGANTCGVPWTKFGRPGFRVLEYQDRDRSCAPVYHRSPYASGLLNVCSLPGFPTKNDFRPRESKHSHFGAGAESAPDASYHD
jgi:hypothetical protein